MSYVVWHAVVGVLHVSFLDKRQIFSNISTSFLFQCYNSCLMFVVSFGQALYDWGYSSFYSHAALKKLPVSEGTLFFLSLLDNDVLVCCIVDLISFYILLTVSFLWCIKLFMRKWNNSPSRVSQLIVQADLSATSKTCLMGNVTWHKQTYYKYMT